MLGQPKTRRKVSVLFKPTTGKIYDGALVLLEREKFDAGYGIPDSLNSVSRGDEDCLAFT